MRNSQFKTKEEYLQYRKDWKAEYKQLSQTIREKRWFNREYQRAYNKATLELPPIERSYNKIYVRTMDLLQTNQRYQDLIQKYKSDKKWVELYSMQATQMLEELKEAKQEAQRQYLTAKAQLQLA